jgi:hypothetical protein
MKGSAGSVIARLLALCAITGVMIMAGCGCSSYEKLHETIWDSAFFMDTATIGVIGWEYDFDFPKGSFGSSKIFNSTQSLYSYEIKTGKLTKLATLTSGQNDYATGEAFYSKPLVAFTTYDGERAIAVRNIETREQKIVERAGGGSIMLEGISPDGKNIWLIHERAKCVDVETGEMVYPISQNDYGASPKYADSACVIFAVTEGDWSYCIFHRKSKQVDTICPFNSRTIMRVNSDKDVYVVDSAHILKYGLIVELIRGVIKTYPFDSVASSQSITNLYTSRNFDVSINLGTYVYSQDGSIYWGFLHDAKESQRILSSSERTRE